MRKLYLHSGRELGKETLTLICQWEHLVSKIVDSGNYRRFLLRYLSAGITLINIRL